MTTVEVKYTLADSFLTTKALVLSTLTPTLCGCVVLFLLRYALFAFRATEYATPSVAKTFVVGVIVLGAAAIIWRPVFAVRRAARQHFLRTYLKDGSVLFVLLSRQLWVGAFSAIASLFLASLAYVVIQTYSAFDLAVVSVACGAGLLASQVVGYVATDSLKHHVTNLLLARTRRGVCLVFVVLAVIANTLIRDTASSWSQLDESEIVDRIVAEEVHPVRNIQRAIRVMRYGEATLLKVRDTMPFPFGWVVYLCLITPQTIPLYAMVCIFMGCDFRPNCGTLLAS